MAGSSAGATVLTDPMVNPGDRARTLGLGAVTAMAATAHSGHALGETVHRPITLWAADLALAGVPDRTAIMRDPPGAWHLMGGGPAEVCSDGEPAGLAPLPAR